MSGQVNQLTNILSHNIRGALKDLLETKVLYQSVDVSIHGLSEVIDKSAAQQKEEVKRAGPTGNPQSLGPDESANTLIEILNKHLSKLLDSDWGFYPETNPPPGSPPLGTSGLPSLQLPSARIACTSKQCKGSIQPHNSGYAGLRYGSTGYDFPSTGSTIQVFSFPYHCQNCKEEPLVFLVKRDGLTLSLVGRSQFPEVSVPDFIPNGQRQFYRKAIIACQTNFTLAAALYLRTMVEQYFHHIIPKTEIKAIKARGNPTGDELADLYAKTLPPNFPGNFPSLKTAYSDLSKIIHSGSEDDQAKEFFQRIRAAVIGHFEAVELFKKMPTQ